MIQINIDKTLDFISKENIYGYKAVEKAQLDLEKEQVKVMTFRLA